MPASAKVAADSGGSVAFSGLVIGIYSVGAIVSLPLMLWYAKNSFRGGMLSMAFTGLLGNALYASASFLDSSTELSALLLSRVICGLEGGTICLFHIALLSTSRGPRSRAQNMSDITLSSAAGLMGGPMMAGVSRIAASAFDNSDIVHISLAAIAPASMMII